jgi:hypothetical protein
MEQAVLVYLYPDVGDDWSVDLVEDPLIEAIETHGVGELDGHDIALDDSGEVILYAYGPDADALFEVMEPILLAVPPAEGSYAVKRYGEAGDPEATEARVELRRP